MSVMSVIGGKLEYFGGCRWVKSSGTYVRQCLLIVLVKICIFMLLFDIIGYCIVGIRFFVCVAVPVHCVCDV